MVMSNRLFIEWEDVKRDNPAILGYILYKHKTGNKPLQYAVNKPASVEATRLQLAPVAQGVITVPYFEDTISRHGDKYEYLVSAIDQFGIESGLSSTASTGSLPKTVIAAPAQGYVRSVKDALDKYEYLVSAIDQFGIESGLSSTASTGSLPKTVIAAPAQVYVRSVKDGVA